MKILGIIPARYASSRLPGKALEKIGGKPMIAHVYERSVMAELLSDVIVATDDNRILKELSERKIPVVMTSAEHRSGTERCNEALQKTRQKYDYVINIQGDEPFIEPEQINTLAGLCDGSAEIATLVSPVQDITEVINPNVVKVVCSRNGRALYFSRSPVPFIRDTDQDFWMDAYPFKKHIGMYAYRSDVLPGLCSLEPGELEMAESLEQLRWLENGYQILVGTTNHAASGVDTPEDLEKARIRWENEHS